jgi:hypothetical protein
MSIILKSGLKSSESVKWIQLAQAMVKCSVLVNPVMNLLVPSKVINFMNNSATIIISRVTLLHVVMIFKAVYNMIMMMVMMMMMMTTTAVHLGL